MEKICYLKKIFKELYLFDYNLKKETKLTMNEAMVLCTISEKKMDLTQLSKELYVSKPRMTKITEKLIKKGFLKKLVSETDKREKYLVLTEKGYKKIHEIKDKKIPFPQIRLIRKKRKIVTIIGDGA
ncbi:MAG: MarR family transcriptional regulator [candidate division WOR-3 bacterium]